MHVAKMLQENAKKAAMARLGRELEAHFAPTVHEEIPASFFNLLRRLEDAERAARLNAKFGLQKQAPAASRLH